MKKLLLAPLIFLSCLNKIPDGTYKAINYNNNSLNHLKQYFIFEGNKFDKYQIRYGQKYKYDSINIIKYDVGNKFTVKRNDSLYEFYYYLNQDTLILKTGGNKIKMIKID